MTTQPNSVTFWVPGEPQPQGSKSPGRVRNGRSTMFESNRDLPAWRTAVSYCALRVKQNPPWDGPVRMELRFRMPRPKNVPKERLGWPCTKPDLDKLYRAIGDACTGIIYKDDGQVCVASQVKEYGAPGVEVTLTRINEQAQEVVE